MKIRLIVPNVLNPHGGNSKTTIRRYGSAIADIAGGFTATQGTGGWKNSSGLLVVEPITIFDCAFDAGGGDCERLNMGPCMFRELAHRIARELQQDCVYLEIDSRVEYIKQ